MARSIKTTSKIPVAMLGLSSTEAIPVYHYSPGGLVVRIALINITSPMFKCDGFPLCVFGDGNRFSLIEVEHRMLIYKARQWRVDGVFLDGLEPLKSLDEEKLVSLIDEFKKQGLFVGARTLGLSSPSIIEYLDFVVVDYMKDYAVDPALPSEAVKLLYDLAGKVKSVWIEVSAYVKEPDIWRLHPLLLALEDTEIPLHVFIEDHKGGGPIRDLYERLRGKIPYIYIHNDLYPWLDTYCPRCGSPIASRDEGILRALEVIDGRKCWKCKYGLAFRGPVRKKTPEQLLLSTEGGVAWFHPSQLVGGYTHQRSRT